jgi:hypothetical protein
MSRKINWMLPLPFFLMLTLLVQRAQAQKDSSPRDQLEQYVAKLQRSPIDDALQEKIIKTASELKPPPAIAEETRQPSMNAAAIRKAVTDQTSYELAISEYRALAGRWRGTNWWERGSRRGGPFSIEFVAIIRDKEIWFLPTRAKVGYLRGIVDADQVENIRWETGYFTRPPPAWVREIAPLGSWFLDLGPPRKVEVEITGSPDRIRYKMPMYSARALDLGDNRYYFLKDAWEFFDLQKVNE